MKTCQRNSRIYRKIFCGDKSTFIETKVIINFPPMSETKHRRKDVEINNPNMAVIRHINLQPFGNDFDSFRGNKADKKNTIVFVFNFLL